MQKKMNQFSDSIDELSTDVESDGGYISTNALKDIQGGSQIHPEINARDFRLKIRDPIKKDQSEWKGAELLEKIIDKGLHKVLKHF